MALKYTPTIGLEIHAELRTNSKMFCGCENAPHANEPNSRICPVCTAQPGSLPVINREAVKHVLKVGTAVNGELADFTEFDRKNYFYPDIPKNYQISQYDYPLVRGGELAGVEITRIHLEEDTGKSTHDEGDYSLVDYNRAGVPLMELVTEPVIHDAQTAGQFAHELQLLLRYIGAGEANMEKGEMRVEANVSVGADDHLGTKTEVKNLNSFRSVERAIAFEIERQKKLLQENKGVTQETRGWDEKKQETFLQRAKEESHDYRYFPDPDLPKLHLSLIDEFSREQLKGELPELPSQKRERYESEFGLASENVETYITNPDLANFFEAVIAELGNNIDHIARASNYITSDLQGLLATEESALFPRPEYFANLIQMIEAGDVSSRGAKDTLALLVKEDRDPQAIAEEHGFIQESDEETLSSLVEEVLAENSEVVKDYKSGNEKVLQFLVGQGMKKSKGSANPGKLAELIKEKTK